MTIEKFPSNRKGKTLGDVSWFQDDFISLEEDFMRRQSSTEKEYAKGPLRTECILCKNPIDATISYSREEVTFAKCQNCGHFNGLFEITEEFANYAYVESSYQNVQQTPYGKEFVSGHLATDYTEVVRRIYAPKVEFLIDALALDGVNPHEYSFTDVGCGSGHFLSALSSAKVTNINGFDTLASAIQVAQGRPELGKAVRLADPDYLTSFLQSGSSDVVSMICVLPHLIEPVQALMAMKSNVNIRYTFQKLPMWSFATLLESVFPENRSRVLGSDHTHVFTQQSLTWLEHEVGMRRVASWSFGSDSLDLIRKLSQKLNKNESTKDFKVLVNEQLNVIAEPLQKAIDEIGQSSEIHVLWAMR